MAMAAGKELQERNDDGEDDDGGETDEGGVLVLPVQLHCLRIFRGVRISRLLCFVAGEETWTFATKVLDGLRYRLGE